MSIAHKTYIGVDSLIRRGLAGGSSLARQLRDHLPSEISIMPNLRLVTSQDPNPENSTKTTNEEMIMLSREWLSPTELDYWKLASDPFEDSPHARKIWIGPQQKTVHAMIKRTARLHDLLAVVGEVGSGKSTIVRQFLAQAERNRQITVLSPASLDRKGLTEGAIATCICRGLAPGEGIPASIEDRSERVRNLLEAANSSGTHPLLMVEEAHDLPVSAFIALKRVWDSFDLYKLLGIVLIGQGNSALTAKSHNPFMRDLQAKLSLPAAREFGQRCKIVTLSPMRLAEVKAYLGWRFKNVEAEVDSIFSEKAIKAMARNKAMAHPLALGNIAISSMRMAQMQADPIVEAGHVQHAMK